MKQFFLAVFSIFILNTRYYLSLIISLSFLSSLITIPTIFPLSFLPSTSLSLILPLSFLLSLYSPPCLSPSPFILLSLILSLSVFLYILHPPFSHTLYISFYFTHSQHPSLPLFPTLLTYLSLPFDFKHLNQ